MEPTDLAKKIEVKRGGNAQYFIYLILIFLFGLIQKIFNISGNYSYIFYIVLALITVLNINKLTTLVFSKVIISADELGVWTNNLQLVPWQKVKEVRLDITNGLYNVSNNRSHKWIDLVIETNEGRKAVFWGNFLNTNPEILCSDLNKYLTMHKLNI